MSEAAVDLERERRESRERELAKLRPSRARAVRASAAEHGGFHAAALALYGRLGEDEATRIAALAASDDPLDDGARRLSREEIEMIMATRTHLTREDRERLRSFIAAEREANPNVEPEAVREKARVELGIPVKRANFLASYWPREKAAPAEGNGGPRKKAAKRAAKKAARKRTPKRTAQSTRTPARKGVVPLDLVVERLEQELRVIEERAAEIRSAIETIRGLDGGAR